MAWGATEIAAAIVNAATVVAGIAVVVKKLKKDNDYDYISTKKENDDYSVDMDKFSQKVKSNQGVTFKDPKTGWLIKQNREGIGHKGDKWKLYNKQGSDRIASLTEDGKIVEK